MTDARGYSWPPFEPGNQAAEVHGARSERRVGPLAEQIAQGLLEHPDTPPYLLEPSYAPVVAAWARAEAVVSLLWDFLADLDGARAALTEETTESEASESLSKARSSRRMTSRRVFSVLGELHRAETRANTLRGRLGLDPLSRAKLAAELGQARWYGSQTPLESYLAEVEAKRRAAIDAGETEAGRG